MELKLSDYIVDFLNKGYSEEAIINYCLKQGRELPSVQNSLAIAKQKIADIKRESNAPTTNLNHLIVNAPANVTQEQVQPVTSVTQPKQNTPRSKMVSVRLPIEMYDIVKNNPSEMIKSAIKMSYTKGSVQ